MGSQGTDVVLSEAAFKQFPFSVECKNRETNKGVYDAFEQAVANCDGTQPVVILGMNNKPPLAVLEFEVFMQLAKAKYEQDKV